MFQVVDMSTRPPRMTEAKSLVEAARLARDRRVEALQEGQGAIGVAVYDPDTETGIPRDVTGMARAALEEHEAVADEADEAVAEAAWRTGDPDGDTVVIEVAGRDLSCSQNGVEEYRRVLYPGSSVTAWPDADRLPPRGIRSAERHCSVETDVPVGTIVQTFSRKVWHGSRGRCSRSYALVGPRGLIELGRHKALRSRNVDVITLPSGATVEVDRPQR